MYWNLGIYFQFLTLPHIAPVQLQCLPYFTDHNTLTCCRLLCVDGKVSKLLSLIQSKKLQFTFARWSSKCVKALTDIQTIALPGTHSQIAILAVYVANTLIPV